MKKTSQQESEEYPKNFKFTPLSSLLKASFTCFYWGVVIWGHLRNFQWFRSSFHDRSGISENFPISRQFDQSYKLGDLFMFRGSLWFFDSWNKQLLQFLSD